MNTERLDQSWQLVLVVTEETLHQLPRTLTDIYSKSLHARPCILAPDTAVVRAGLSGLTHPIAYNLSPTIASGSYWAAVVSAHRFVANRTIFLQAGTRLPNHWDARLVAAGQRAKSAFAVSPQSARHPLLSVFARTDYEPELSVDEVDQWLNDYVAGIEYTVPVILESCALLQGEFWRVRTFSFSSDHQLLSELRLSGGTVLATDHLYVDDFNTENVFVNNDTRHIPTAYVDAHVQRPPLAMAHHALQELSLRREKPVVMRDCLPVQLHVGHSWGGGLGRWIEDYIAADDAHNHLVLRSIGDLSAFGQTIALYRSAELGMPIKTWTLSEPILSINLVSHEYLEIVEALVDMFNVESVVISSLVGHSLDLLRTSLPTTVVLHDYFPFCPALYATFGSPCLSCSDVDLRKCMNENPRNSYFKFEGHEHWLSVRREFVRLLSSGSYTLVAPTQSVANRYRSLERSFRDIAIDVIPHGLDVKLAQSLQPISLPAESRSGAGSRLKIVMLGRLTEEKGANLLSHIQSQLGQIAELHLLGTGESGAEYRHLPGIKVRESYDRAELASLLAETNPDIGMLLSTVPETFSYTLSELWAAGIPVLATRLGAFADRISESHNGWLVESDSAHILEKLEELVKNRNMINDAKRFIARQPVRTAVQMVSDYAALVPESSDIPLIRYSLPRRSYCNPYRLSLAGKESDALYINHQSSYLDVLASFLRYSGRKLVQTPKLPARVGRPLGTLLLRVSRYLDGG